MDEPQKGKLLLGRSRELSMEGASSVFLAQAKGDHIASLQNVAVQYILVDAEDEDNLMPAQLGTVAFDDAASWPDSKSAEQQVAVVP